MLVNIVGLDPNDLEEVLSASENTESKKALDESENPSEKMRNHLKEKFPGVYASTLRQMFSKR